MASRKILVQLDIAAASDLTSPLSGFVGFSAKDDGLYQKIGTSPELRLLTSADVQNAILADGSITGAVSQAQTFTLGVKLSNLTQGYIPYASGATKLLNNSPIYTDGTNVGIGTTNPTAKLFVAADDTHYDASLTYGNPSAFIIKNAGVELAQGVSSNWPWNYWIQSRQSSGTAWPLSLNPLGGNVGIGTPAPNQQLEITQNFRLPSTAGTTPYGIIYKDTTPFIHDFNYGNNGTVTTVGGNTFIGLNAGNLTMGSTATETYESSYNVGLGSNSLMNNTAGYSNTALGNASLFSNTTGNSNIALGNASLFSNTTGNSNIALGNASLINNTTGSLNVALGLSAGQNIASKSTGALNSNNSIFIGYRTSPLNDNETNQIVIGHDAIGAGSNKTVIGNSSVTDTYFGSSTGSSKLWASALNLSGLTASKVVFTDGSKNLTSTGIGTASQFIKGDGSLDSNTYITSGSISGFVPYTGANDNVNLGTYNLSCNEISATSTLTIGNTITSQYTDGGYLYVQTISTSYAQLSFYSKDTFNGFGIVQIIANPEEGIILRSSSNDYSSDSYLEIMQWGFGFYTNSLKRLEIAQSGSINAFGNTITSTGGFIGNASTATKLQTARTITIGNQSLSFDGTANLTYTLANIGVPTGSGVDGRITFWSGTNSLSSSANLTWDNTSSRLSVNSISLASSFKLGASSTAGYVLTTDANGNGTWQAPQGGGNIVSSVFGRTGTVVAVNGDYNTSQVTENTNLYFTDSRARVAISLTINGQSGASTYNNSTGILNVPNYSLTGLGGVPKTRTITINGEVQDLSANRTWNVGDLLSTGSYSNPSWLTSLAWSKITNKPTTFYGYGITETPWTSYLPLSGGTLTGDLNSKRIICQSIIGDDYNTGAIEILGSYDNTFYPTLGFHQPSNFAASIQLRGAIDFRLYAQGGTTYANLTTNKLISASLQIGTSTTSGYVLTADANGNGTWQAPTGGGVTIGAIGSVPNANGMSISGQTLSLQPASATYGGIVTTGTQTLAGAKTLSSLLTASAGIANNGSYTQTGTSANTFTGTSTFSNATYSALFTGGNVGIGTPTPNQQLEITQNFRLPSTAGTTPYGIIYKDTTPFIHDFNYGNNGTVTTSGGNTFVGINAGNLTMGSTATLAYQGSYNVGLGLNSLISNTTGFYNTAVGVSSLQSNTTGYYNTANGVNTLLYNTTGYCNTANGFGSLQSNTTGYCNTALGYNSGSYLADGTTGRTTGNNGLYLGLNSKASANGTDNEIVIGYNAIGVGSNKTVLGNSSVTDTYFGSSTGSSKLWASALNLSGLTASKVVFTDGSKNLTSTGIGTASQFIKGDGSLDSNTYLTTGTAIISGSGVDGRITFWSGTNSLSSNSNLTWDNTNSRLTVYSIFSVGSFKLGTNATAGYVLTTDANGKGTWQAPTGGSYTLPTASASVLGVVKIGSGITISSGVISVSTNYEAPLTFSSGLTRSGNAISVTSGTYVPFVGADRDVNLASYSIYAYDFLVYSDINLKCNIEDIKMKKLDINYKQFEYKTSRGEKRYGVIAQELLSIAPEFVSESNNSYAVKYTDLLIYEVAQLKEEVKQLKSLLCR